MGAGKRLIWLWAALAAVQLQGAEPGRPGSDGPAAVTIGGEVQIDYAYRRVAGPADIPDVSASDLSVGLARLRLNAGLHPGVSAFFKLDLQSGGGERSSRGGDAMLEEALLVFGLAGGPGWSFYAGQGRAPYGQDVTLGMLQSYHHAANRSGSPEGDVFIVPPPERDAAPAGGGAPRRLPEPRPGQLDRVFLAGAAYEWDSRWRVELAAFQPGGRERADPARRRDGAGPDKGSELGLAGRVWWRPVEDLTLEASFTAAHSGALGRTEERTDLPAGARAAAWGRSLSLGFDWRRGPWRFFGEWEHAWNWDFSRHYSAEIRQLGLGREIAPGWRAGAMAESLRLSAASAAGLRVDSFYKLALNLRYSAAPGWFVLAEYGHEWLFRRTGGEPDQRKRGWFIGLRTGLVF